MICRVCGNATSNTLYRAKEMMFGLREEFDYFQCSACDCLQIKIVPDNLGAYYPTNYNGFTLPKKKLFAGFQGLLKRQSYLAALFPHTHSAALPARLVPNQQYQLLGTLSLRMDSRIVDVGSGQGAYLYPLYELGMKNVQGIDPFIPETLVYPNGYRVEKGFVNDLNGEWDVLIYNHSFEHVPNPQENLQHVRRLLAPNGTAVIRTPTVSSYAWEYYRTDWFQLDAPRHLFLHSVKSMDLLTQQAGLKLIDVVYDSTHAQFVHSEKYKRGIAMYEDANSLYHGWADRKLKKWQYQRRAEKLNAEKRGDQASFIIRKR